MDQDVEYQRQSGEIDQLMAAMNRAQIVMLPALKDKVNPFFHSKYADLSSVWDALHPFRAEGIVLTQSPQESPDGYIVLDTQLTHVSGQWIRSRLKMRLGKDDPQGAGSALTYARRYALGCMTGLVTEEEDDANAASPQPTTKNFAQKFPEQARAIQEKLKEPVVNPSASLLPGDGAWIVPFGKNKGQRIADVSEGDMDYLLKYYLGKLHDPANTTSRFRDEWDHAAVEIHAEMLARMPAEAKP